MSNIILTETIEVNGKYFYRHERFEYISQVWINVLCVTCGTSNKYKMQLHFRISIDNIDYDIPDTACCEYNGDFDDARIDIVNYLYTKYSDNITDYKKAVQQYLGIDTTYKADISANYLRYVEQEKEFFRRTDARIKKNTT